MIFLSNPGENYYCQSSFNTEHFKICFLRSFVDSDGSTDKFSLYVYYPAVQSLLTKMIYEIILPVQQFDEL